MRKNSKKWIYFFLAIISLIVILALAMSSCSGDEENSRKTVKVERKNIVEKASGSIWFETEENIGTTFFGKFPIMISTG